MFPSSGSKLVGWGHDELIFVYEIDDSDSELCERGAANKNDKLQENRCFHDHNRWERGQKCQIAISSSFLFAVHTGPQRASSSPLSSTLFQSYCSKWPPHTSPSNGTWQHPHHSNFHPTWGRKLPCNIYMVIGSLGQWRGSLFWEISLGMW